MNSKKSVITSIILLVIYVIIGAVAGGFLFSNLDNIPPAAIFLVCVALIVFAGLGAGVKALAKLTKLTNSTLFCYLPLAQDIVIYNVVRGIRTTSSLHGVLKKFNLLLTSSVMMVIGCMAPIISQNFIVKALESGENSDEVIQQILSINNIVLIVVLVVIAVAYIIRCLYLDPIFKLVYRSVPIRILAIIPIAQIILLAIMPNQINYRLATR